jgi:tousled-like kinase
VADRERQLVDRERQLADRERQLLERENALVAASHELRVASATDPQVILARNRAVEGVTRIKAALEAMVIDRAREDLAGWRARVAQDNERIGRVVLRHTGHMVGEVWEDGAESRRVEGRLAEVRAERDKVEAARKVLVKRKPAAMPPPPAPTAGGTSSSSSTSSHPGLRPARLDFLAFDDAELLATTTTTTTLAAAPALTSMAPPSGAATLTLDEYNEQEEIYKMRLKKLAADEKTLAAELESLELDKLRHRREIKLLRDYDASRFHSHPVLNRRYVLQRLIGKGGFSEVFKAYDLVMCRDVALKIHQVNPQWSPEKKDNYNKHAIRENQIHRALDHRHVVQVHEVFELEPGESFCTVLEFCPGGDLDMRLKAMKTMDEREAKVVIVQLFSGLKYLNERPDKVIHYDLKPGNVIFVSDGSYECKITDFGLSKIMGASDEAEMELTSQGSGTYWYLPPETFLRGGNVMISSKVDVWSCGVIFYQMLYGKKPFGDDQSQQAILREQTILKSAQSIDFPPRPVVSEEAKAFIRLCLTYDKNLRPDVLQIADHKYLKYSQPPPRASRAKETAVTATT